MKNSKYSIKLKDGREKDRIPCRGSFVIATYRRPEILENVLQSIYNCDNSNNYFKIVVLQGKDSTSLEIINKYLDDMTILVRVSGIEKSPLENITNNFLTALSIAFDYCNSDFAIEIEDDSFISNQSLHFIEYIYAVYRKKSKFRGINLGSHEVDPNLVGTYSLLRTGFHASHGVITKNSWNYMSKNRIKNRIKREPMDATIEWYWKTGFVATPNLSLCTNLGWLNGTHASKNPNDSHFRRISESFKAAGQCDNWELYNIQHSWVPNPLIYRPIDNPRFIIKFILDAAWKTKFGCTLKFWRQQIKRKVQILFRPI